MVGEIAGRLVETIRRMGPETMVDMDLALQAEAFDVIGRVGYAVDFQATADLSGPGAMAADNITHGKHPSNLPCDRSDGFVWNRTLATGTWFALPLGFEQQLNPRKVANVIKTCKTEVVFDSDWRHKML
jgi:hypothetical protein